MTSSEITQLFEAFNGLNALIIGDVMVDAYIWGKVERISPEAPVPIVAVSRRENRMGGAANVALNVKALGANPILCAVIGADDSGQVFRDLLAKDGLSTAGMVDSEHRVTSVKTRVLGSNQQIVRVDEENIWSLNAEEQKNLLSRVAEVLEKETIDVIIFEDYDKGVITEEVISSVVAMAQERNIPTAVDPKKRNFLHYRNTTLFKPNLKEIREGLVMDINPSSKESLDAALQQLVEALDIDLALVTLSELGVTVGNGDFRAHFPAHIRSIADVSGAGDTVISVAALCLAQGVDPGLMAQLANLAGGLVCEKVGVVPIDKALLRAEALELVTQLASARPE